MNCPKCNQEMKKGILWLGNTHSASKVVFSPAETVSWGRRLGQGGTFSPKLKDGEVMILERGWRDKTVERTAYHCEACGLLVCDVQDE